MDSGAEDKYVGIETTTIVSKMAYAIGKRLDNKELLELSYGHSSGTWHTCILMCAWEHGGIFEKTVVDPATCNNPH